MARSACKIGDVLGGKYRIERIVGSGGVGVVASAVHIELGQRVAIKVLQDDVEKELKERFLREARAVVRMKSEHIARVTDVGKTTSGAPYIVMELLEGEDLGRLLERGPLRVEFAVALVLQACEGLAEAHANGIVHRDLKPRNLFLTHRVHGEPLVKVLDFGIAKSYDVGADEKELTGTESVFGSPQYMSPEQMRASRNVDARADVWSLGICLYELIAGALPFDAPTVPLICVQVLTAPTPSLLDRRPDVPPALWQVIQRCLEKEPYMRWGDVAQLAGALEPFAPPAAAGTALRADAVLRTPPVNAAASGPLPQMTAPDAIGDTRTAGSFNTPRERTGSVRNTIIVAASAAAFVLVAAAVAYRLHSPSDASVATQTHEIRSVVAPTQQPLPVINVQAAASEIPSTPNLGSTADSGAAAAPTGSIKAGIVKPNPTHGRKPDGGLGNPSKVF